MEAVVPELSVSTVVINLCSIQLEQVLNCYVFLKLVLCQINCLIFFLFLFVLPMWLAVSRVSS